MHSHYLNGDICYLCCRSCANPAVVAGVVPHCPWQCQVAGQGMLRPYGCKVSHVGLEVGLASYIWNSW